MLISFAGCGNNPNHKSSLDSTSDVAISDFYLYVNKDWVDENALDDSSYYISMFDYYSTQVYKNLINAYSAGTYNNLDDSDVLKKYAMLFDCLSDEEYYSASQKLIDVTIKQVLEIDSINEYMNLFTDEMYSLFNPFINVKYYLSSDNTYIPYVSFDTIGDFDGVLEEKYYSIYKESFARMLKSYGMDLYEARPFVSTGLAIDRQLREYMSSRSSYAEYTYDYFYKRESGFDILDCLNKTGYLNLDQAKGKDIIFACPKGYLLWLNDNLTNDNLEALKAYYILNLLDKTAAIGPKDAYYEYVRIWAQIGGAKETYPIDNYEKAANALYSNYLDPLIPYYKTNFIEDYVLDDVDKITGELKDSYQDMIDDFNWPNYFQKIKLSRKISSIKVNTGSCDNADSLDNFAIYDNPLYTTITLMQCERDLVQKEAREGKLTYSDYSYFQTNAYYNTEKNQINILAGYLSNPLYYEDAPYEVKMALLGSIIAHEMGHSLDISNYYYDSHNKFNNSLLKNSNEYLNFSDNLCNYYSSFTTLNGNEINGYAFTNEIMSDYLAMDAMLRVLKKHRNIDYDLFFRTYTMSNAEIYRKEYEAISLEYGDHPPYRDRINCTLAQFDIFYDTYNIDKESPYYLDKEDRIKPY